jgi:hypothetical protein
MLGNKPSGRTVALMLRHPKLSDEHYKIIENHSPMEVAKGLMELYDEGIQLRPHELQFLHSIANRRKPIEHDVEQVGTWDDKVLNGYMEHIRNYTYNYKPEATQIDPSIDPDQEHIGPMAQDIEKVNPAAIIETAEGVKTVDIGRLALMNAGAIAELVREVASLKEGVNG